MAESEKLSWYKIASHVSEIPFSANNLASFEMNGKQVCLGKFEGRIFAFANICPHASGLLSEGEIDKSGNVICPVHQYKYDMRNGRNVTGEGYYLKRWPLELRADGIYIGITTTP